ncbi:TonB-dependent receptor [Pseudoalteromonas shioyasakiensis]|uniref:TonB-dependent receptor n=1 Tax=Pseudoalteromonas shioyasakiensis TaxID=1190813 RepID=A0ABT6TVR1_9GAMM|nr:MULTISPECIES: TonB-dependent receptor [Pseudoalteromonas]MDI4667979.1 TonB-dependent receptor [Pseudoalteromonas shioyasakiensis]MDI4672791.1 TonB-dependent receptor [Pseudoalteromonas shioyasakiensis]MDI4684855.1 TonB-dependent receptor [Pseudoalteromonas shioyasakiensis]MDI4703181.1 TonB-dependent receptor [Pseudoalteromonas shioyasakiensis]NUJ20192.1 TonB-dependent receptor [Pseudoalteromonas sp. 0802]
MKQVSILSSAVAAALFSQSTMAAVITGQVLDKNQQPISNAEIHVHGKSQSVVTDKQGQFKIDVDNKGQLHISKNNFIDKRVAINGEDQNVVVTLTPTSVETVVVYASALHKNSLEMISPVNVLAGDELKDKAKPTLGETLKGLPGVNASYFGPVSSSPIIRGLDGPRVKITQNGLDSSDASRIGPDHATSNDSLAAEQIEVLRGPATLLYGSGAIGGVVNVVDNRIPTDNIESLTGAAQYTHDTVSNTNTYAAKLETGNDGFNFHFDGTKRKGHDYDTPNFELPEEHEEHEEHEGEEHEEHETANSVENTFIDSQTVNFGTSYVGDHLTLGVSFGRIETDYGIPAHEHHHHEEEEDHDEHEGEEEHEESVFAQLEQDRWQGYMSYALHDNWIENISLRVGYTDYKHAEIEDGAVGTVFTNKTTEARATVEHKLGLWHGMAGYHYTESDYDADGEEAFTPASVTKTNALFVLEERQFGDVTVELGARLEDYQIDSAVSMAEHHHDHDHEEEEEHHDEEEAEIINYSEDFTNLSLSAGAIWQYQEGQSVALSVSRSERAPLSAELLSNGIHIATGTYELGLGYHIEDGEIHFEPEDIEQETATNFDLSFRRFIGDFGYTINFFYNDIENYYYQQNTGLVFDEEHGLESAADADEDAMAVYQFTSKDAKLYGIEFDVHYQVTPSALVKVFGDSTTAKLKDDEGYLPRIPANKLGSELQYTVSDWKFSLTGTHYFEQSDITAYETKTDGYTLFDASANYQLDLGPVDTQLYINVDNLTDELGFVHSSFIKEKAPLPGRNFSLGIRGYF